MLDLDKYMEISRKVKVLGKELNIKQPTVAMIERVNDVQEQADGTRTGFIDLNGTPVEIKVNKDGTITALNEINTAANYAARTRYITFLPDYSSSTSFQKHNEWLNNGGWGNQSAYNGLDNVPFDGYRAVLHKGERVLTAEENKSYSSKMEIDYSKMEQCMRAAVRELTLEIGSREFGRIIDDRLRERRLI